MKSLKLKKFCLIVSLLFTLFACNNHCSKNHESSGTKNPVIGHPTIKDTSINDHSRTGSPNKEYDQHKIDSIKANKTKPKGNRVGKND